MPNIYASNSLVVSLATKWPAYSIGHKVACLFYWPQSGLFVLLATKWPVCFVGHKVACLFYWPQSGQCICITIMSLRPILLTFTAFACAMLAQ